MRTNRIALPAVIAAGISAAVALVVASPAQGQAAAPTVCTGTLGAVTVSGVVVPDGAACVLDGTKVDGGITVGARAALQTSSVTVKRDVTLTNSGRLLATGTAVGGTVSSTATGLINFTDSVVASNVTVSQDTTFAATRLGVGGDLRGSQLNRLDLANSWVGGAVVADGAFAGSRFCGNLVGGNAEFLAGGAAIQIGGSSSCAGSRVGGDVVVNDNQAEITIGGNTIYHNLSCAGNDPAPTGSGNDVRGSKLGQCAAL
jgi:hypothetical protein